MRSRPFSRSSPPVWPRGATGRLRSTPPTTSGGSGRHEARILSDYPPCGNGGAGRGRHGGHHPLPEFRARPPAAGVDAIGRQVFRALQPQAAPPNSPRSSPRAISILMQLATAVATAARASRSAGDGPAATSYPPAPARVRVTLGWVEGIDVSRWSPSATPKQFDKKQELVVEIATRDGRVHRSGRTRAF